jgi:hypothetical protein
VRKRQRSLTLEGKAEAAIDQLLDGKTLEGLACGISGRHLGEFYFAPGECGELITICRDFVKTSKASGKPWRPTEFFPHPGNDCIGFREYAKSPESDDVNEPKYSIWLDFGPYGGLPPGSIGIIRLKVDEDNYKYFYLGDVPMYPADVDRIKDADERARRRQSHGMVQVP